jgi:aminoglycoside phosphotransferase (APT) family kinase protein
VLTIDLPVVIGADHPVDRVRLSDYLRRNIPDLTEELEVSQFPSGHSNLTYMIRSGMREFVLKCEPAGPKAKSAHDMGREFRILSKLYGEYSFAPRPFLYCEDDSIIGGKFCVMERLKGVIIRSEYPKDGTIEPGQVRGQFIGLIDALAELHSLDILAIGLSDFGRPQGYRQRQLDGWRRRLYDAKTDNMVDFDEVISRLTEHMPRTEEQAAIIHNDFKMDNLVWDSEKITKLVGVLDWEMATVGDPLMDLACTLSFWAEEGDPEEFRSMRGMPSARPEVWSRREAIEHYSERTKRPVADAKFYLAFGLFRRAVIEQQKYFRYSRALTQDSRFAKLDKSVRVLRDMSLSILSGEISV